MNTETSALRSKNAGLFFDTTLVLASLSLGGILLVSEAERLPTLSYATYQHGPNLATSIILAVFFGLLLAGKYFKSSTKRTPPALIGVLALALSASLTGILAPADLFAPWVYILCDLAHSILWPIFLYVWIRKILPLGYSYTIQSFALGLVVVAILNLLTMAMNTGVSIVVITLLPLISAGLLIAVKTPDHSYESEISFNHHGESAKKQHLQFVFFNIIPLVCFAIVFGNIHQSWNALQDGSVVSLIVQLGVAAGTLLAGLGVYGLYAIGTLRKYNSIVMLILIAFTLFSIWLSTYTNENLVFLYAAFLNIAQKGVFLLIFLAPFRGPWRDPLFGWCSSMYAFLCGTYISSLLMSFNAESVLITFAVVAVGLLLASAVAMLVKDIEESKLYENKPAQHEPSSELQTNPVNSLNEAAQPIKQSTVPIADSHEITQDTDAQPNNEPVTVHETTSSSPTDSNTPHYSKDEEYVACMRLTHEFALTRREADVLTLLVHGRTAEPIAKTLGISHATAKTHLRNIYNKLGVHTQQEVIDLMENYIRKD